MEAYDSSIVDDDCVAVRAVWLLFKRGRWGYLEDFGVVREIAEPLLVAFDQTVTGDRLTKAQCKQLQFVPGVREAATEMRLAYALKFYAEGKVREILSRGSNDTLAS